MIIVSCGLARHLVVVVHDDHLRLSWWCGNQDYPYGPYDQDDRDDVMAVLVALSPWWWTQSNMFSLIIYEIGKHILFFFSLIVIIKMIVMTIVIICNHGRTLGIPQLPILAPFWWWSIRPIALSLAPSLPSLWSIWSPSRVGNADHPHHQSSWKKSDHHAQDDQGWVMLINKSSTYSAPPAVYRVHKRSANHISNM